MMTDLAPPVGPAVLPLAPVGVTPVRVLTIAGTDSGGGAGVPADLRTFALAGCHGCVAVTAVTVQNSLGVTGFEVVPPEVVAAQVRTVVTDIGVSAAKTGMLATAAVVRSVAAMWAELAPGPLVVDPVAASMHGDPLLAMDALSAYRDDLFPLAALVTPNLDEVRLLTGVEVVDEASQRSAARVLHEHGQAWTLVKGGHLRTSGRSIDLLFDGADFLAYPAERVATTHDHGAGDTLAAATACALAHGFDVPTAVAFGKRWVTRSVAAAYPLGAGHGPVSPLWRLHPGG